MLNHRPVFRLAIPMLLSSITVPLFGLVDTAVLGHLDNAKYLAAVAIGTSVVSFVLWSLGFLRMGTTSMGAQQMGRQDFHGLKLLIWQSLVLALLLGLLLMALAPLLTPLAVALMQSGTKLAPLSQEYINIRLLGAPAALGVYAIVGWFIGLQTTRPVLYIAIFANAINIAFDLLFVIGFGWNSAGAALASVIADYSGFGLGLCMVWRHYRRFPKTQAIKPLLFSWPRYRQLLTVNRQLFVRTLFLLGSLSFFTAQGARFGEVTLAANAILMQLVYLTSYGLDGFAHATEALIGKAIGSRNKVAFQSACLTAGLWSGIVAIAFSLGFWLFKPALMALFSNNPEVNALVELYYPWLLALPLVSASAYLLDGVFIGASKTGDMQLSVIMAVLLVFLPVWGLSQGWGNHGLWLAFTCFNGARGLFLGLAFYYRHKTAWQ